MTFHWVGANAIEDGDESGSMTLSPVLKNHNAYLIHNETLYCEPGEEWRGGVEAKLSNVKRAGSFALFHLFSTRACPLTFCVAATQATTAV